jgi:hypothetical protein
MPLKTLPFLLLIVSTLAWGQSPFRLSFNHLTRENGLSNNNIFSFYTDSRGFVWMGSFSGLNRFDGVNVKVYKSYNSTITGTQISNIIEDKTGNLWIGSNAGLNFYSRKNDAFEVMKGPDSQKLYKAYPIRFDDKGLLWLIIPDTKATRLYTYNTETRKYSLITSDIVDHLSLNQGKNYQQVKTLFSAGKNFIGLRKLSFDRDKLIKTETFFDGSKGLPATPNLTDYVSIDNDSIAWITGLKNKLYRLNYLKNTIRVFEANEEIDLLQMSFYANYIFMGSGKGLIIFDKKTERFVQHLSHSKLNQYGLASDWNEIVYIDSHGNLFASQLGIGVDFTNVNRYLAEYWVKPEDVQPYGIKENWVVNILNNNDFIFAQSRHGKNLVLNKNGEIVDSFEGTGLLFVDSQNRTWYTDGRSLYTYNPLTKKKEKLYFAELDNKFGWQNSGTETEKGHYLFTGSFGMYEYNEVQKKLIPIIDVNNRKFLNISPVYYDKNSKQVFFSANWWTQQYALGKTNGEWRIKTKIELFKSTQGIKASINPNKVWFCTNNGLHLLDTKTYKSEIKTEKDGLPDDFVTDIFEESNGNYWLVTNLGISYYNKSKKEYLRFTSKDGAYSPEYDWSSAFRLSTGKVVFGGKNGITAFDDKALNQKPDAPKVQITQLAVNEKPLKTQSYIGEANQIELQPSENTFSIDIAGIEYGFPEKVKLQYQLQGFDHQWITVKNPATARYVNVPEDTYTFVTRAMDETEKVSSEIRKITIIVHAPFYRTTWFRGLLVLSFVLLGYLFYRLRVKQIRAEAEKKEEIKRIRAEAEINALRSQMNPHFIFNCLNTIDFYILHHKTDEASEFLNKFSKLIRMILENSRQDFVSVGQDFKALELYIKLEQERSHPRFEYDISIDESINLNELYVPSMLIQPFVENAILHGLKHKRDSIGELFLNIKITDNQLIINIIDNGIGREASQKINQLRSVLRQSVGVKLSEERIAKLNEMYPVKSYLKIKDIDQQNDKGTIVEIGLPLINHRDHHN